MAAIYRNPPRAFRINCTYIRRYPSNPNYRNLHRKNHLCAFGQNSHRRTDKLTELLSVTLGTDFFFCLNFFFQKVYSYNLRKKVFSLHMHAKPSFAHRLQTAKMASSRSSAQKMALGCKIIALR